jgi:hypothetical protein
MEDVNANNIREYLQETLVQLIEVKAAKCDDEEWITGIPGAVLEGRISMVNEILEWINNQGPL